MSGPARFEQLRLATPMDTRRAIREGFWTGSSRGLAIGKVQAGLMVLPREYRERFLEYCRLNWRACPIIEALEPGVFNTGRAARGADIRTDFAGYRIESGGKTQDVPDLLEFWDESACAFLIGCSYTFEGAIQSVGVKVPGLDENRGNALFRTIQQSDEVGPFGGPLVVSMRSFRDTDVDVVKEVTAPIQLGHGAPIQVGNPEALGIFDITRPDWGPPGSVGDGEVPLFWACSVTASEAARRAQLPWFVTHVPSKTFITDLEADG